MNRRRFLGVSGAAALALPFLLSPRSPSRRAGLGPRAASAGGGGPAKNLVIFYFPDGIAGRSSDGEPSLWEPVGSERAFTLPAQLEPLLPHRERCVFLKGLSMGPTDSGSHPGGAKKLLTATDGGQGESIDQYLARTAGAAAPFRHLCLGAMANHNNASGDKHISYASAGRSTPPEDSPARAFARIFGGGGGGMGAADPVEASVLDAALADLSELRGRLGAAERGKLDLHLEALRDLERRVKGLGAAPTCKDPRIDDGGLADQALYAPENFPTVLRAQMDLAVQALGCGLTRVAVIQASMHTSELIMSRFRGTEMYDPGFDMRSHQASHYGPRHDAGRRDFRDYVAQRRWFVSQFAYLLGELQRRPAGEGTLLDGTLALLCSEVSDGNTHSHDDMPFVLAGGGGGALKTGRLLDYRGRRHGDLLLSLAWAMGERIERFGQGGQGPLPGLLTLG